MNNKNEIKKQLDEIYGEYKKKNNKLSEGKSNNVVHLLMQMTNNSEAKEQDVAKELSRFSSNICINYFAKLMKSSSSNVELTDDIIKAMLSFDTDKNKSAIYAKKYSYTVTAIINNSGAEIFKSRMLPKLVMTIVKATRTENQKHDFEILINKTNGSIFELDYSAYSQSSLFDLCQLIKSVYPDLNKCKYLNNVSEWGEKYGFPMSVQENQTMEVSASKNGNQSAKVPEIKNSGSRENNRSNNNGSAGNTVPDPKTKKSDEKADISAKGTLNSDNKNKKDTEFNHKESGNFVYGKDNSEMLANIRDEGRKTRELLSQELLTLQNTVSSFKSELSKSIEVSNANLILQKKVEGLEAELETLKQVNETQKITIEQITKEKSELMIKSNEIEEQLKKAFDLNNRETDNKADKVRFDILKAVKLSYENWLEYENAEYSEENYESLKAIIKSLFRGLDRSGIDIKG